MFEFCLIDCVNYECFILIVINKVYNPKLCFHSSHFKNHLQKVCGLGTRDASGNLKPCLNIETRERNRCLPPILNFYDEFSKSYEKGACQGQGEVLGT